MSHFELIRQQAIDFRREICGANFNELIAVETLLELTEKHTRIKRLGVKKDDSMLCGALAVLDEGLIYFDKTLPPNYAFFCQAHEYAHFRLHEISAHCTAAEINFAVAETDGFDAESRVLGYGQSERTEREANVFAAEFLLPCQLAKKIFVEEKLNASQIARKIGISVNLVYLQLAQSLIEISDFKSQISNEEINQKSEDQKPKTEDRTQIDASQTEICPTLLEAAPGTGKTRTLIDRICFLLKEKAVAPESILALTFSNKAAEEMRERIAEAVDKETATRLYLTTFHAFGLNLLRKYHNAARLSANAPVIDRIAAIELLEEKLLSLELKHFQNLREPLENLPAILSTVSRAKDELVSAADFQKLAEAQMQKAATAEEVEKAEKVLETARVYRIYEDILRERKLLDYGDLIFRAVQLLRENPAICEQINEEFQHILVDEYQDVNLSSAELLRLVSNGGNGVWAVGDARQAIYRWRGAATTRNVRDFSKDFPSPQNLYLGKNYRSRPKIVRAVSCFAKELDEESAENFTDWAAHRAEETGEIRFAVTENFAEETAWMAEQMRDLQAKGICWREQAVIARTHKILQKAAAELEKQNIPVLYLGNWLESEIVRDLCAWLALLGGDKYALVRVADFDAYRISFANVQRVVSDAIDNQTSGFEAMKTLAAAPVCDEETKNSFEKLSTDFTKMPNGAAVWEILTNYLFEQSAYLTDFEKNKNASERLALYQLLQLAQSFDAKNSAKNLSREQAIDEFLRYVRRLKIFGEEQALQQLPASMQETDAVRLLTIHASKGLEFEAVFVPYLGARYYPKPGKENKCPLPAGVTDLDEKSERAKEEKSLFFVAISRARQTLCLSRSMKYGKQPSNASAFLKSLAEHLPFSPESGASWYSKDFTAEIEQEIEISLIENLQKPEFFLRELEDYENCPRRYFYQTRLKKEKISGAIYLEFHRALHKALNFCLDEKASQRQVSFEKLQEIFRENWTQSAHAYSELYTKEAFEILQNAYARISGEPKNLKRKVFHFDLPNGRVLFAPDFFQERETATGEKNLSAKYWRNGKLRKKESDETLYKLLHESAKTDGSEIEINVASLKNGEEIFVPRKLRRGKEIPPEEKFSSLIEAVDGILRQDFAPKPNDNCPACRFYFICSSNSV